MGNQGGTHSLNMNTKGTCTVSKKKKNKQLGQVESSKKEECLIWPFKFGTLCPKISVKNVLSIFFFLFFFSQ